MKKFGRKRSFRKRSSRKPKLAAKNLSRRITKIEKGIELKYTDFEVTKTMIEAGDIQYIYPVLTFDASTPQGRIGDEVRPTSVNIHATVKLDSTNVTGGIIGRLMVLWDRVPGGALPTLFAPSGAILDNSVITETVNMPYNHELRDRFKILWDHRFALNSNFATTTVPATGVVSAVNSNVLSIKKKIKLGRTVKYGSNSGSGSITDVSANSLLMVFISDQSSDGPICIMGSRVYFKDA